MNLAMEEGAAAKEGDIGAEAGFQAVELLYHAFITGLILTFVTRAGAGDAARLVFATYRRQHLEKFLPGLDKLGLRGLPDPVAAAQYHYLSNQLGGVGVEYVYESDDKAWIRYPPPRWIWEGTALCAVPSEVTRAMLAGWHAHNGVSLGNPYMGFVCTGMATDGDPGLEGYYCRYDRPLAPEERLRFAPGEMAPPADPSRQPRVAEAAWPPLRRAKALRNYAMDYVRVMLLEAVANFGPAQGGALAGIAARQIGLHYYRESAALLGLDRPGPEAFAAYLVALAEAQGDEAEWRREGGQVLVRQRSWRLMRGAGLLSPAVFSAWNELWVGAGLAADRTLRLEAVQRLDRGDSCIEWRLGPAAAASL